jgi:hypothetical protein
MPTKKSRRSFSRSRPSREEKAEIVVAAQDIDPFHRSAGAWKDLVDCEKLIRDISRDRVIRTPEATTVTTRDFERIDGPQTESV